MKFQGLLVGLLILLGGCTSNITEPSASSASDSPQVLKEQDALVSPTSAKTTITTDGFGPARLGMTLRELKQALPEADFQVEAPFMVDIDAIAVRSGAEVQFYILYLSSDMLTDADPIQLLLTDSPKFRTPEGVGPGTRIQEAETVYGPATLNYHTANESRESVKFARHPYPNINFRSDQWGGEWGLAGIYPDSDQGEYYQTSQYRENATIGAIMLDERR